MEHKTIKCLTFEQHTGTQISMRGKVFLHFLISMMEFFGTLFFGNRREEQRKTERKEKDYSR